MWGKSQPVTPLLTSLERSVSNKSVQGSPQQQSHPNPPALGGDVGGGGREGERAATAPGAAPGRGAGRRCWSPPRPALGPWWEEGGVSQGGLFRGTLGL